MKEKIAGKIRETIGSLQASGVWPAFDVPEIVVDYPRNGGFGDYTTNIAMVLAKSLGKSPIEIAEQIVGSCVHSEEFDQVEAVRPGYVNFTLAISALQSVVQTVLSEGVQYGNHPAKQSSINNEFVSANPTGPLHLGNGRGGFYGDSLSRVLRKAGYTVMNEYYVNDAGEQVLRLGHSVLKDSEAAYTGEYIDELGALFVGKTDVVEVGREAADQVLEKYIKPTLEEKLLIRYDSWISERRDVIEPGYVDRAIGKFTEAGLTYEEDGALWLRTTQYGDDKDRVLVKKDGTKTYFASDCGYILNKIGRGFDQLIEIWGADHHGYIARFRAAAQALGFSGEIRFVMVQMVRLMKDGKEVRMSKRAGNVVYIDELVDRVGHDVARFLTLMYSPDTHLNFDLDIAEERSQKNPVFYAQYAHARLANILAKAQEESWDTESVGDVALLIHPKERALMKELFLFPELIGEWAQSYAVHQLPQYAIRLADRLHGFYDECRVIDAANPELSRARLGLVRAAKTVFGETLRLIGVSAPERM